MFTCCFFTNNPCDLDIWTSKSITHRSNVLTKTTQLVKHESSVINNCSQGNEWKPLIENVTLATLLTQTQ